MKPTIGLLVAFLVLAGCGGEDNDKTARSTKTAEVAGVVPESLAGTWTRTFTRRELAGDLPSGLYTMHLDGNTMELYEGDDADPNQECLTQEWCFTLDVKAKGNVLTIGETTTCTGSGEYSFDVVADTLKTKRIKDSCDTARPRVLDGRTWTRGG